MNRLNPNSVKNIPAYVIPSPYGIDMIVNGLQAKFGELPWVEKSFSRAVSMVKEVEGQESVYPGIFTGDGMDFANLIEVDNYSAYCFFFAKDSETVDGYSKGIRNTYSRELSAIFWMNLQQIDNTRGDDFLEELKQDILKSIANARFTNSANNGQVLGIEVTEIYDEPKNIFQGFSFDLLKTQFLHYPYRGIRLDIDCSYIENC